MVTFDGVTLVEPSRGDYVSRKKKIFREKKELGSKRVDRKQPGVPDLDSFREKSSFWNRSECSHIHVEQAYHGRE
jgi:hypothetical protein